MIAPKQTKTSASWISISLYIVVYTIVVNMFSVSLTWKAHDSTEIIQNQNPDLLDFLQLLPGVWMTKSTTCAGPRQWPIHYCCHTSWCGRGRRGGHRDESHKLHQCLADVANFWREQESWKEAQELKSVKRDCSYSESSPWSYCYFCRCVCFVMPLHAVRVKMGFEWTWCVSPYGNVVACIVIAWSEWNM